MKTLTLTAWLTVVFYFIGSSLFAIWLMWKTDPLIGLVSAGVLGFLLYQFVTD